MDNKSYYAIIPANVRYDENLKDKAKLLYGELTALTNDRGYCWASNNYFAELYKVSKSTISRLIKNLSDEGYIKVELQYENKEVKARKIWLSSATPIRKNAYTPTQNCGEGIDENAYTPIGKNVKGNNTLYNNTINNTVNKNKEDKSSNASKKFIKPTHEEIHEYCIEKGYELDIDGFIDYYESKGWIVGRTKMKDWKATVRNWVRRSNGFQNVCDNRGSRSSTAEKLDGDYNMIKDWGQEDKNREQFTYSSYNPEDMDF